VRANKWLSAWRRFMANHSTIHLSFYHNPCKSKMKQGTIHDNGNGLFGHYALPSSLPSPPPWSHHPHIISLPLLWWSSIDGSLHPSDCESTLSPMMHGWPFYFVRFFAQSLPCSSVSSTSSQHVRRCTHPATLEPSTQWWWWHPLLLGLVTLAPQPSSVSCTSPMFLLLTTKLTRQEKISLLLVNYLVIFSSPHDEGNWNSPILRRL